MMVHEPILYDAATIDSFPEPTSAVKRKALNYLRPLIFEGAHHFVANVKTKMLLLSIDDLLLPITVNEAEYANSYVVSNYFPVAHLEEHDDAFRKALAYLLGIVFRSVKVNKVVLVNNWLFSVNLYPPLLPKQIDAVRAKLAETFPDHVIMFRSVNTLHSPLLLEGLRQTHFTLFGGRAIFVYDPSQKGALSSKAKAHHKRDFRLIDKMGYKVVRQEELTAEDMPRLLDLYRQVYIEKYTAYSPAYTEKFLQNALKTGFLELIALKKEGRIDGVFGFVSNSALCNSPFLGFDTHLKDSGLLYRMLTILIIREAEARNLVLNDSSGGKAPKKYRGLKAYPEYSAFYVEHLPWYRRMVWKGIAFSLRLVFPLIFRLTS